MPFRHISGKEAYMHIGAHVEVIGQGIPYAQAFPMLKALGADGVELVMREGAQLDLNSTDADFLRAAELAADAGLKISGLTAGYTWSLPMTSGDKNIRERGYRALLRQLEGARLLGTDSLLIVPGYASTIFYPSAEKVEVPATLGRAREAISKALESAACLRVSLNVEDVWNGMLRDPREMAAFVDGFTSEWIGVYFDVANVYPEGDPAVWIRALGKRITKAVGVRCRTSMKNLTIAGGNGNWDVRPINSIHWVKITQPLTGRWQRSKKIMVSARKAGAPR